MSSELMAHKRDYLRRKVNPLIQQLMVSLMKEEPEYVEDFCYQWFEQRRTGKGGNLTADQMASKASPQIRQGSEHSSSKSDEDSEEFDMAKVQARSKNKLGQPRTSVSAEVYGRFNQKKEYKAKIVPKTEAQKIRIRDRLSQAFMFSALDEKEKQIIIDAMEVKEFRSGDIVIQQGDSGDVLYVIDEGKLECSKIFSGKSSPTFLKYYNPGESFGELALLYNVPRAATIKALQNCILFSLDRECFNSIVKQAAINKLNKYTEFLRKIDIFKSLDNYEIGKVCECLNQQTYKPGEYVIREVGQSSAREKPEIVSTLSWTEKVEQPRRSVAKRRQSSNIKTAAITSESSP